jgi:hypothetical protein
MECCRQFSAKSCTEFAHSKLPYRKILRAIAEFSAGAAGVAALEVSLKLNVQYKTAWKLLHRLRRAMTRDFDTSLFSGHVEIDGTEFGGYLRPRNSRKRPSKIDSAKIVRNLWKMPKGQNKRVCMIVRERDGLRRSRTFICKSEGEAEKFILPLLGPDVILHADCQTKFNTLVRRLKKRLRRINHSEAFCTPHSHTNNAENFFSVFKWAAQAVYRNFSKSEILAALYAEEIAWRMTYEKISNTSKFTRLVQAVMNPQLVKAAAN